MTHPSDQPEVTVPVEMGDLPGVVAETDPVEAEQPVKTWVRYRIIMISFLTAFILYLDRICVSEIAKSESFSVDMQLSNEQIGRVMGSFFFAYALFQIPAGWLSDRFGGRRMLTLYIVGWSIFTALTGLMTTAIGLVFVRLGFGVMQAGAYPTLSATIRRWIRLSRRGQASSLVSVGGRLGGTLAPPLTVLTIWLLGGWRETLWFYGGIGVLIAALYWWIVRDQPGEHPNCNEFEQLHIGHNAGEKKPQLRDIPPMLWSCCTSRSLWLNSLLQFSVNVGWAFLVSWLPFYLKQSEVPAGQASMMVAGVLGMGLVGQPIGGWATDWSVRQFGLRVGRVLPICVASLVASAAYVSCLFVGSVWGVVLCCGVVSLMTDIGNPSTWAFMQDVGGRNTAAIFGWANMWGNFGAALNAVMIPQLMAYGSEDGSGQTLVFLALAGAFLIAAISALGMDATRPLKTGLSE